MSNPLTEVLALSRLPAMVAGDIRAIAEAALRVSVIERTLLDLKEKVDEAIELPPDPDNDERAPLLRAKDATSGGSSSSWS